MGHEWRASLGRTIGGVSNLSDYWTSAGWPTGTYVTFFDRIDAAEGILTTGLWPFEDGHADVQAPGEAEAELALMNRQGKIDAVLSDDGDALLFGAKCLIRKCVFPRLLAALERDILIDSNSATLSGTKASQHVSTTKGDMKTYEVFRSDAICAAWTSEEGTALRTEEHCHLAMVWIALLAGGDYVPEGIETFGASCIKYTSAVSPRLT